MAQRSAASGNAVRRYGGEVGKIEKYSMLSSLSPTLARTNSKSALISLGRSLGRELAPDKIYVTVVAPGIIDTPQLQVDADDAGVSLEEMHSIYAKNIPAGRIGTPDDVARAVVFLSTETARAYAGQTLHPNGQNGA